ncbi:hypothetical protein Cfor_05829, partial [Coptotermes formosanus]
FTVTFRTRFISSADDIEHSVTANSPPQLLEDINNLPVSEGTPVGKVLFTVNATDPEGSPVHYGILDTDQVGVDKDTGE